MSVQEVFNATAASYDPARRKLIPCFDRFYETAVELLPQSSRTVLELGAGTGLFTTFLRQRLPEAKLHLVDVSERMLEQARERLQDDAHVTTEIADYSIAKLAAGQDAVVSALSIHHLEHEAKQRLFVRVFEALQPGGLFLNADQVAGPTDSLEEAYVQRWLEAVRLRGATETQIEESLYRQREDRRASVQDQLQWLRNAGFSDVDCWYKDGSFAVFAARREERSEVV